VTSLESSVLTVVGKGEDFPRARSYGELGVVIQRKIEAMMTVVAELRPSALRAARRLISRVESLWCSPQAGQNLNRPA